jgi:hypothetical protein
MATLDAAQKAEVYCILYRLNLSFTRIVDSCRELQGTGVFRAKFTRLHQAFAQELQAEINEEALGILHGIETDDLYRFGKVRDARDKELRDPDDVFIHAKERRKELARQRKKKPRGKSERSKRARLFSACRVLNCLCWCGSFNSPNHNS